VKRDMFLSDRRVTEKFRVEKSNEQSINRT
jgi:hypothetical protein